MIRQPAAFWEARAELLARRPELASGITAEVVEAVVMS